MVTQDCRTEIVLKSTIHDAKIYGNHRNVSYCRIMREYVPKGQFFEIRSLL